MNGIVSFIIYLIFVINYFSRYGSDLASVESFRQNNFTANLAADFRDGKEDYSYWLGLQAHNELQTNTLGTDAGGQISQYYGHWAQDHPNVEEGTCVKSVLKPNGDTFDQVNIFEFSQLLPIHAALEPSCCKQRQKKSRARNWFGE